MDTVSTTCDSGWVRKQFGALNAQISAALPQYEVIDETPYSYAPTRYRDCVKNRFVQLGV